MLRVWSGWHRPLREQGRAWWGPHGHGEFRQGRVQVGWELGEAPGGVEPLTSWSLVPVQLPASCPRQRLRGTQSALDWGCPTTTRQHLRADEESHQQELSLLSAQNPPPSPVPERCVARGHTDHNPRSGDQCPHLHRSYRLPLPRLA